MARGDNCFAYKMNHKHYLHGLPAMQRTPTFALAKVFCPLQRKNLLKTLLDK